MGDQQPVVVMNNNTVHNDIEQQRYTSRALVPLVKKKKQHELGAPPPPNVEQRQYKMWSTGVPVPLHLPSKVTTIDADLQHHQKGVPLATFMRMVDYVDRAMSKCNNNINNLQRKPLILDVHNNGPLSTKPGTTEPDNYFLVYYPNNRVAALKILQALYVTHGDEHSALVQALCSPDIMEREMPSAQSRALVARYSGVQPGSSRCDVGEWEYTYHIDDLEKCFGQYLYVQQCHANMDAMYGY